VLLLSGPIVCPGVVIELRRGGYPETAELVRAITGAADVVVFDHNIRRGGDRAKVQPACGVKRPVFHIHTDFSGKSAQIRAAAVVGKAQTTDQRIAAINVWRPIAGPLRDCPLAICDASSVEERDLLATDLLYSDRTGEIYYVAFNPAHRWFYASDMRINEVWMFKNYDSATDGRARQRLWLKSREAHSRDISSPSACISPKNWIIGGSFTSHFSDIASQALPWQMAGSVLI